MRTRTVALVGVIALAVVLVAGCADGFPAGTYETALGLFRIDFNRDGTVVVYDPSDTVVDTGTYSVKGSELTFETSDHCDGPYPEKATYTWLLEDDVLTLEVVGEDPCGGRWMTLSTPWHRASE